MNNYYRGYNQAPPPNPLNEGPISLKQINKNGSKIFGMLKGIHKELKFMDNEHIQMDEKDGVWNPISRKTNMIGKKIEERMNLGIDDGDLYYINNDTGNYIQQPQQIMNYGMQTQHIPAHNTTLNPQVKEQNNQFQYNRTIVEKEKTMSKVDDVDISEFIGGTSVGDSFDKTVFVNMDKTNKSILANTTKICKLIGLLIQLENKNGSRLEKIIERLDTHDDRDIEADFDGDEDLELDDIK